VQEFSIRKSRDIAATKYTAKDLLWRTLVDEGAPMALFGAKIEAARAP